jgi:hypothetical protein
MAAAIGPAIGLVGSLFGHKTSPQSQTSTINQQNVPWFTPEQQSVNGMLGRVLKRLGKKPQVDERLRIQGRNQINDVFDQQQSAFDSLMAGRGFGDSGKANAGALNLRLNRGQAMGKLESDLYNQAIQRQMQALGLATGFGRAEGSTTTGTTTGTVPGNTWGQAAMGAIPGIANDIGTSIWLRRILGQGTSPGFGSAPGLGGVPDPYANPYGEGGN